MEYWARRHRRLEKSWKNHGKPGKSRYWIGGGKEGGFIVLDLAVKYCELPSFSLGLH
jgi:hypothetical protein